MNATALKVLIVDDEPLARARAATLVADCAEPRCEVVGQCANGREALAWLAVHRADVALLKAWRADHQGNLVYRKTSRNFNPMAAMCSKVSIAEVEEIVPNGTLDPDHVHTPGIFVQRIVVNATPEKRIEQRTVRSK